MHEHAVAAVRKVKLPLLFIYGSDPWIPVGESVQQLRSLINQHHNIQYAVVPNASNEMMHVEHDTMAFDEKTTNEIAPQLPEYFTLMASWLCGKPKSDFGIGFIEFGECADSHCTGIS